MDTTANGRSRQPEGDAEGPRRRRRWPFVVGGLVALGLVGLAIVAVVLILAAGGTTVPTVYDEEYVSGDGPDTIAVVAVVLEIDSPGGGVTASDEMHQSILDFRENSGKPVVVSMGDVAASGGYYISTAADRIVANETTLTGSLGVIIPLNNFAEAADKYGIKQVVIKSGKYKDMGSAFREMRPDEREIFQSIVDGLYSEFVDVISEGRKIPEERVREIADGRVYSGLQAKKLGLVDSFGNLDDAAATAGRLAGERDTTLVRYVQTPTLFETVLARLAPQEPQAQQIMEAAGLDLEPKPYYLYLPGS